MSDVLESPQITDPNSVPFIGTAVRTGVIGGLVFIVYGMIITITGLSMPSNGFGFMFLNLFISLGLSAGIGAMAVKKHRDDELGGYIPFGRAFLTAIVAITVAGILSAAFNYFYQTVIDPELLPTMVEQMEEMYEKMGMSESQIETAMEQVRDGFEPSKMFVQGLMYAVIGGGIISLIVAAIMKKNPEVQL